ncbi:hypothetical protein AB0P17_29350 [Streptomyces sp. NPDC088124]|uniref:hypothetical protein n=1 Tax=Streptomyces sp. NPDC088124 TaxID=3154654 RepID=UPI00342404A3
MSSWRCALFPDPTPVNTTQQKASSATSTVGEEQKIDAVHRLGVMSERHPELKRRVAEARLELIEAERRFEPSLSLRHPPSTSPSTSCRSMRRARPAGGDRDEAPEARALFPEAIQAWASGPVCPALYELHQGHFEIEVGFVAKRLRVRINVETTWPRSE